jgi:hypothetical protein
MTRAVMGRFDTPPLAGAPPTRSLTPGHAPAYGHALASHALPSSSSSSYGTPRSTI